MSSTTNPNQKPPTTPEEFKSIQKDNWNTVAQGWKRWWDTFEHGAQTLSDRLVDLANVKPGDKILDIATGIGEPAVTAAKKMKHKGQVIAIDMSSEMLAIAKERAQKLGLNDIVTFIESDAESYSYPTSEFNAVLSRWAIMLFPNFVTTMQKIHRSLTSEGRIVAAVWSNSSKAPMLAVPYRIIAKAVA